MSDLFGGPAGAVSSTVGGIPAPQPPPKKVSLADTVNQAAGAAGGVAGKAMDNNRKQAIRLARGTPGREGTMIVHSLFPNLSPHSALDVDRLGNVGGDNGGGRMFYPVIPQRGR